MGKAQKKHGKGRLDHYYRLAKEKGYRARSSFKIIQINEKFGHFLEKSKVVIDLCAAPGSWCQVASNLCPINSLIIGVDLAPIKPLPNVITFQSDITTEHCRTQLRGHMKTWKADAVLHDGAPNVGMAWTQDAFTQSELVLQSLKLAVEFLIQGGTFVTKVFRSKDYNNLMWVFQQFFDKVEATKPPSSRNVSAEIFVVCRGFKAPKKIDPKLLDSKHVFEELQDPTPNYQAKVFNPELKRRKRDGYEEGDYTQYHTMSALEFIKHEDPIQCLGGMSAFSFDHHEEPELKQVKKLPQTTDELLECFKDLKVLGKKDFRMILKWRLAARDLLGIDVKEEKTEEEAEPLTEEERIEKELQELQDQERLRKKREKRNANERKQKEITRLQMNMMTPGDIGIDAGSQGQSLFNLKHAEKTGKLSDLIKGKKSMVFNNGGADDEVDMGDAKESANGNGYEDYDSDDAADNLDAQLDDMYIDYKKRKAERDAKYQAKMARENGDDEWDGFEEKQNNSDSDSDVLEAEDSDSDSDSDGDESINKLINTLRPSKVGDLSRKAAVFFDNPLFKSLDVDSPVSTNTSTNVTNVKTNGKVNGITNGKANGSTNGKVNGTTNGSSNSATELESDDGSESDSDFEVVAREPESDDDEENEWDTEKDKREEPYVDIVTAQAMTLAHQLALGQKSKHSLIDEGYNRYTFRDKDGLPDWFLDDESKHSKLQKPITKEAAEAIKEKLKAMNARPIKKVAEAQARKKYKAHQKLEKIRKKTDLINEDDSKSEKEKSEDIAKLMRKLTKKKSDKPKVTVIAAKGANRGLQGRPKGVKGKYKMVDGTLKKEQRALNRIQKKMKKKKH
ncbi:Spb1p [Sugiyamaella lignohabitans]|uniref:Spb1p n=1 Tax=Sugiyamaella lignohabitans TaxID=796027 RepID=A0A167CBA4_9ASCO|nr:Spb1p [Sugiyamaella lignohabitans]ANB11460.1 Spb1p [Sugiyamaella lignohabitans]